MRRTAWLPALLISSTILSGTTSDTTLSANWPAWRGPTLDGVSSEKNLPVTWGPTQNIAWKLQMPQWSGATPVIWGDIIFLNVAEADRQNLSLWAVNRLDRRSRSGSGRWAAAITREQKQNMSSPSPVTDGTTVWVNDRHRHAPRIRFQRQRALAARHSEGLRQVRAQLGLRQLAAARRRRSHRPGAARDEDGRPVVHSAHRRQDRQDRVAGRTADASDPGIAGRVHYARAGEARQRHGDRDHRRRRRHRSRSGQRQGVVARRRAEPAEQSGVSHCRLAGRAQGHHHRADARAAAARAQSWRPRRRDDVAQAVGVPQRAGRAHAGDRRHVSATSSPIAASSIASSC